MKITIDNKEIGYFIIDENGRVLETGEEEGLDTFGSTMIDLKSIKKGSYLKLCFNKDAKGTYIELNGLNNPLKKVRAIWVELNYKTLCIE